MPDGRDQASLLRLRARLNRCVRGFFEDAGFVEVETPLLAERLIPEPSIGIFAAEQHHADGTSRELYLTPSPELWMKRLVAAGMPRVYQLARCFRNVEEQGPFHQREFTMLEWYAVDEDYGAALTRMEGLLAALRAELASTPGGDAAAGAPVQRVTMAKLWQDEVGCDPAHASAQELAALARRLDIPAAETDTWEQLFNRIFLTRVEPRIARRHPVAVLDYPARIPTLAAPAGDGVHAQRWELYLAGIEVANCFQEQTDRAALSKLLTQEARRQQDARVVPRPDLALADAFAPVAACSGVAVGIDRLYALLLGLPAIAPVMACTGGA
jgi:lysyl-tRNA synthetase class 2